MDPIQIYPQGLFDLLNIKQGGGRGLANLEQNVRPTLDMFDIYASPNVVHTSAQTAAAILNSTVSLTVPQQETWFLYGIEASVSFVDIGDTFAVQADIFSTQPGSLGIAFSGRDTATNANENLSTGRAFERPLVLKPGDGARAVLTVFEPVVAPSVVLAVTIRVARVGPESTITTL